MRSFRRESILAIPSERKAGGIVNVRPLRQAFSGSSSAPGTGRYQRRKMEGTIRTRNTSHSIWTIRNGDSRITQRGQQRIPVLAIERVSATRSLGGNLDSGTAANEVPDAAGTPSPAEAAPTSPADIDPLGLDDVRVVKTYAPSSEPVNGHVDHRSKKLQAPQERHSPPAPASHQSAPRVAEGHSSRSASLPQAGQAANVADDQEGPRAGWHPV